MVKKEDILSLEFLKKSEYTGCDNGMRYRIEKVEKEEGKMLQATVWPEPFNFRMTPEEEKRKCEFSFSEDGVKDAVDWMNNVYFEERERFKRD